MAANRDAINKANTPELLAALAKTHGYSDKWVEAINKSREKYQNKENV